MTRKILFGQDSRSKAPNTLQNDNLLTENPSLSKFNNIWPNQQDGCEDKELKPDDTTSPRCSLFLVEDLFYI